MTAALTAAVSKGVAGSYRRGKSVVDGRGASGNNRVGFQVATNISESHGIIPHSEDEARLAAVVSRTSSEVDVAAIGAILLPAFPAFEHVETLARPVAREICLPHDGLAVRVFVANSRRG